TDFVKTLILVPDSTKSISATKNYGRSCKWNVPISSVIMLHNKQICRANKHSGMPICISVDCSMSWIAASMPPCTSLSLHLAEIACTDTLPVKPYRYQKICLFLHTILTISVKQQA